ncbi:oxidoreductase [Prosthecochloris sp. GSB1]|uniref:SDR family NAD(P)-dependent oxidoreductase n=1 Tax=Prosthecochloris sp. GSB1 TaxID=281093 RepID=UPI000B8C7999|nr:SDR family NAD(P)-dependent oxidoreductase [Prosthecochloris sp. GSB1]ASQ89631.1 oxidoreductase [Prosthecochloris sp. GSB1]
MKRVIIIGATSGIGRALAALYAVEGWTVGLCGRRTSLLEELRDTLGPSVRVQPMDVADTEAARQRFLDLAAALGGVDHVIISAGTGYLDPAFPWEKERDTLMTNVAGFAVIAHAAFDLFRRQGFGHLAGISSVAAVRGGPAPVYNASKAFVSSYLQGLRCRAVSEGLPITVTDILPGFVDTAMAKGDGLFWVAPREKAARQIFNALEKRKPVVYVTRRWRMVALLLRLLPEPLYRALVCKKRENGAEAHGR